MNAPAESKRLDWLAVKDAQTHQSGLDQEGNRDQSFDSNRYDLFSFYWNWDTGVQRLIGGRKPEENRVPCAGRLLLFEKSLSWWNCSSSVACLCVELWNGTGRELINWGRERSCRHGEGLSVE